MNASNFIPLAGITFCVVQAGDACPGPLIWGYGGFFLLVIGRTKFMLDELNKYK